MDLTPRLCTRGCGFFGTAENGGLCSKCHNVYLKELMAKSEAVIIEQEIEKLVDTMKSVTISESHSNNSSVCVPPPVVMKKNRCRLCNKKVGLLGFQCRCGGTFCGKHRYPEAHPCRFDFKNSGKLVIQKENPVCKSDKIIDRV